MTAPHAASATTPSAKMPPAPERIQVIVATDCGSTTTKAILIELVDGHYRQTQRGEAPTTVEAPFADVTLGVTNSVTELQELSGRRLIADDGTVIRRTSLSDPNGCDVYISRRPPRAADCR